MEGYFVRTLGMHRVYNSAFMHMLRDEDNAGYRKVIRDTLEFDPEILKRYVNFMTNPDEETAVEQFGTGDKYFGVATLLATLPGPADDRPRPDRGLRARSTGWSSAGRASTSSPTRALVARFEREIVPLLHERWRFAGRGRLPPVRRRGRRRRRRRGRLRLLERRGARRSLVVYHNRFGSTAAGWIRDSVPFAGRRRMARRPLLVRADARATAAGGGPGDGERSSPSARPAPGSSSCGPASEIRERGLFVELDAYRALVFGGFRELQSGPEAPWSAWRRLSAVAACLARRGASDLRLAPVHAAVAALLAPGLDPNEIASRRATFLERAGVAAGAPAEAKARRGRSSPPADLEPAVKPPACCARSTGRRSIVCGWRRSCAAWDWTRPRSRGPGSPSIWHRHPTWPPTGLAAAWLRDPDVRAFLEVHEWEGVEWFAKESFETLLAVATEVDRARGATRPAPAIGKLAKAAEAAGYRVDRFLAELEAPPSAGGPRPPRPPRSRSRSS